MRMQIVLRRNLLYLLVLFLGWFIRKILVIIIKQFYKFNKNFIFLYLMTLGEITGGLSVYLYQYSNIRGKKKPKYFKYKLIHNKNEIESIDNRFTVYALIFFAGFFDFIEFIIMNFYVANHIISVTIIDRLGCLLTITSSLVCTYALKFKVGKHHTFSQRLLIICVCLTLVVEILYKPENIDMGIFILTHFLICCYLMFLSFTDCIERYLVDKDYLNPFLIIMREGIIEFIMALLYSIGKNPLKDMINLYNEKSAASFVLLIFLLIMHLILSAIINAYKVYCNTIYSPMARSIIDHFMNPFFNIFYYLYYGDFQNNFFYFFICEIICLTSDFFFCVYNEYIILYCCGLEHDTKDEITRRGSSMDFELMLTKTIDEDYDILSEKNNIESEAY